MISSSIRNVTTKSTKSLDSYSYFLLQRLKVSAKSGKKARYLLKGFVSTLINLSDGSDSDIALREIRFLPSKEPIVFLNNIIPECLQIKFP